VTGKRSNNAGGQQRIVEGALDAVRPGWRDRTAKRKSPWNLLGSLVAGAITVATGYGLWRGAWRLHVFFYPAHTTRLHEFWQAGLSGRAFISSFLLAMPLFVPALVIGLLVSNFLMWLIPPARRAMKAEAGGDYEMTFGGANLGLMKWGGIASIIALILVVIGASTLSILR
jgi:hypothetical protein